MSEGRLRVLIGGEYSGTIRDAFIARGHDAMSCDFSRSAVPGPHYQGDWADIEGDGWDLAIFHRTCTYMANSGAKHLYRGMKKENGIDEATEYATQITRGPGGHLCGYVGIPHDHPWFGKGYSDQVAVPREVIERPIDVDKVGAINLFCAAASADAIAAGLLDIVLAIDVHGGLTYASAKAPGSVIEGLWWFGFDCAHVGDLTPSNAERFGGAMQNEVYRDIGFVQAEVASLARQLAAVALSPRSARHG